MGSCRLWTMAGLGLVCDLWHCIWRRVPDELAGGPWFHLSRGLGWSSLAEATAGRVTLLSTLMESLAQIHLSASAQRLFPNQGPWSPCLPPLPPSHIILLTLIVTSKLIKALLYRRDNEWGSWQASRNPRSIWVSKKRKRKKISGCQTDKQKQAWKY